MSQPLVAFRGAALGYDRKTPVLAEVDLRIEEGSFWGILGHNGSGKTTILKAMLGLLGVQRGKVERRRGAQALRFGYVPQRETLDSIFPLKARDVAAMGTFRHLDLLGRWRDRRSRALVERCLADCGAADLSDRLYGSLSSGQKQRVLIARALAAEPNLLVLDEPLAGVDATTQKALLDLLKSLKERHELTVMMVTHRIRAEKTLFTDIAWVGEGQIACGPAATMLEDRRVKEVFSSEL